MHNFKCCKYVCNLLPTERKMQITLILMTAIIMLATQYAITKRSSEKQPICKKMCAAPRRPLRKRCEIQGDSIEMAVMVD